MRYTHLFMPLALVSAMAVVQQANADEGFIAQDIRILGLNRVAVTQAHAYIPFRAGDKVTDAQIAQAIRSLYTSGLFDDISSQNNQGILTFHVVERPLISKVTLKGNRLIPKDALTNGLKQMGLVEGGVFKKSVVEQIESELEQQYSQQGRYNANVTVKTTPSDKVGRVEVTVEVDEGTPAKVVDINIIGNTAFKEDDLKQLFVVREQDWSTVVSRKDRYAREKMAASLEKLRNQYLNNGYVNFEIENSQLNISEDKRHIYVDVTVKEGEKFTFGDTKLLGDVLFEPLELEVLQLYKTGETYSQERVNAVKQLLLNKFANAGYYYAEINVIPKINEETKTVDLAYYINPGQQVKVRRINIQGHTKTADDVLRREIRQMEGALAIKEKIELSKIRLERTGYFKSVEMNVIRVPNSVDEIDIEVKVEEQHSGSTSFAVGYSQSGGMTFQAGLSQTNFMGTGHRVALDLTRSQTQDYYNLAVTNPYATIDGVSRGFNLYYRKTKESSSYSVSNYATDSYGGSLSYGYPIDEDQSLSVSLGVDQTKIITGTYVSTYVRDYLLKNKGKVRDYFVDADGNRTTEGSKFEGDYLTYNLNLAWAYNTLNRPVFPTKGSLYRINLEAAIPGGDLDYQKITYEAQSFYPLGKTGLVLRGYGKMGYGNNLPFYKHFFAGGYGSLRGYEINSLGPRYDAVYYNNALSTAQTADPDPEYVGGNAMVQFGTELVLPLPAKGDWTRNVRPVLFLEGAQVFDTQCEALQDSTLQGGVSAKKYCKDNYAFDFSNMRYSAGVGLTWITMIGPLSLSYSYPLNKKQGDETKNVQFEIGRTF